MKKLRCSLFLLLLAAGTFTTVSAQNQTAPVKDTSLGKTSNVHVCGTLFLAGQPEPDDIRTIKSQGIRRVITLRTDGEIDWDEQALVTDAGIEFEKVPFRSPDSLTEDVFDRVRQLLNDSGATPTLLHCGSANRVGAVWLTHRVLDQNVPLEDALVEAREIGLRTPEYEARARAYIEQHQRRGKQSVRPGINDNFLKTDLDIDEWLGRFEIESREVFAARHEVLTATGVRPGMHVADIGAGTGFFTRLFSRAVGDEGWVYAVDIAPRFIEHISQRADNDGLSNISAVLCPQDAVSLPPQSIDLAFICDTYHHFEYPHATLSSIYRALRPGGTLVVIDFERIPGQSREFILNHVRAGKEVFRAEIEAAGFEMIEEVPMSQFEENYFLRLKKK